MEGVHFSGSMPGPRPRAGSAGFCAIRAWGLCWAIKKCHDDDTAYMMLFFMVKGHLPSCLPSYLPALLPAFLLALLSRICIWWPQAKAARVGATGCLPRVDIRG